MKPLKKHLSISEQVDLLISRGLIIHDRAAAEKTLADVNYYRLTGYLHNYREPGTDRYMPGITWETLKRIYDFDRRFSKLLMFILEDVEETLKTRLSYTLTQAYPDDPLVYLDSGIYKNEHEFQSFEKYFQKSVENNKNLPFVKHHLDMYEGNLPMWVAVELFTMGNLNAFYKNLKTTFQKKIARTYGTGSEQMKSWIQELTYTRNHVAHNMRLHNFNFGRTPEKCRNHPAPPSTNMIFDQIFVMCCMYSNRKEWLGYVLPEFSALLEEYRDVVALSHLGFPENWQDILS